MKKKNVFVVGLICMSMLSFSGCKATPKDATVVKKDTNQMVAKAVSKSNTKYEVPSNYKDTYTNESKNLKVNIDADIVRDASLNYPVVEVEKREFTNDEAKKFIDTFTNGKELYNADVAVTKSDIQNRIIELKKDMNENGDSEIDGMKISKIIKELKVKMQTAPATVKRELASKKLVPYGNNGGSRVYGYTEEADHRKAYLLIDNSCVGNEVEVRYTNFPDPEQVNYIPADPSQYPKNITIAPIKISKDDAKKKAEELVKKLGIKDMGVNSIETAVDYNKGQENMGSKKKVTLNSAYEVVFTRSFKGIVTNYDTATCSVVRLGDKNTLKVIGDKTDDNAVSETWETENIAVLVDDSGIIGFHYNSPYKVGKQIIDNSRLLKFNDVKKVIKKMLICQNENDDDTVKLELKVKKISMGLQKVKEKNEKTKALIVPVWTITGDQIYDYGDGKPQTIKDMKLLQINGVDGSVISSDEDMN
ncbi:hypothetical protein lbkm_4166 [Lachnospiraceae bacterium KM106-2]|nr:hypothetical protein lbkm_4166 [Lachnospiraceae bacterium KM106-2]